MIQTVERAFSYNPELKSSQESRQVSRYAVDRAKAGYLPKVYAYGNAGVSELSDATSRQVREQHEYRTFTESGIKLTQPIWYGGQTMADVAAREAEFSSAENMLEDKASSLAFDAIAAHIEVIRRHDLVVLALENVEQHEQILRTVRTRYNTNIATVGELNQVLSRHARAKATLSAYESGLDSAKASYLRVTGRNPGDLVPAVETALAFADIDAVREACLTGNPRIKAAIADVNAAIGDRDVAESRYYPRLDAEFGPSWSDRDTKADARYDSVEASLRMRWDIFSGGADQASVRMSNASIRQSRQILHALMNILNEDIESSYSRWLSSVVQAKEYDAAKKASRLAREDYYRQFLSAQRSLIDVLDAENDYFYAAGQEVMCVSDRVIATYRLLTLSGALLSRLNIDAASLRVDQATTGESGEHLRSAFDTPLFSKSSSAKK